MTCPDQPKSDRPHEQVLDAVYDRLSANDPFMPLTGFIDHTTMAAEALVALGQGHRLEAWASRARARPFEPRPSGISIGTDWEQALGERKYLADWIAHFNRELGEYPTRNVLGRWVARFAHAPGVFLFHGLIRVGHAARALRHRNTPQRRTELARGLALWAIGVKSPPLPDSAAIPAGSEILERPVDFARVAALAYARRPDIRTLHLVTGPMAAQLLEDDAGEEVTRIFSSGFARTHADLIRSRRSPAVPDPAAQVITIDEQRLGSLADVHDIKLTEAALRGYELTGDPTFLRAAKAI
jgi:hypothetical protein